MKRLIVILVLFLMSSYVMIQKVENFEKPQAEKGTSRTDAITKAVSTLELSNTS